MLQQNAPYLFDGVWVSLHRMAGADNFLGSGALQMRAAVLHKTIISIFRWSAAADTDD
jgi:hypothetical protein